jgi:hypothetical protein
VAQLLRMLQISTEYQCFILATDNVTLDANQVDYHKAEYLQSPTHPAP